MALGLSLALATSNCPTSLGQDAGTGGAFALYHNGDWQGAEQRAATASDAASKTLAAQSILARLMIGEFAQLPRSDRREAARRAQAHSRAALDIDPDYAPAHLRLAAGLGYEARYRSAVSAAMARLPQRGLNHIERALALDPDISWAHAMLGAWHLEVARQGGEGTFGSDVATGLAAYRRAVTMDAIEPAIPYHFALALIALDPVIHGEEARALLAQAQSIEANDMFDTEAQRLAAELDARLNEDLERAQALAIERLEQ